MVVSGSNNTFMNKIFLAHAIRLLKRQDNAGKSFFLSTKNGSLILQKEVIQSFYFF